MIPTFNLSELEQNVELFHYVKNSLKRDIQSKFDFRKQDCILLLDGKEFTMSSGRILANLTLLQFFVNCGIKIIEKDLYLADSITGDSIKEYSNHCLARYSENYNDSFELFREQLMNVMNEISDNSAGFNVQKGVTMSLKDFIVLAATDDKAKEMLRPEIPNGLQFNEIEGIFSKVGGEFIDYIKNHENLDLFDYITSETGINVKQFTQMCCFVGLKPDMHGGVIPVLNKDNFLYGLRSLENYYINCVGTRKALCTNYTYVRKSGLTLDHYKSSKLTGNSLEL